LTPGEVELVHSVFGGAIELGDVSIRRRKWFPFQPRQVAMTPRGHIHFHPAADAYCDDFARADINAQGLFIHEMTHVWQTQQLGAWYLVLMRHPFCRYDYTVRPGWRLQRYGLEQQAEIVRHTFQLRHGATIRGAFPREVYDSILPFRPSGS
jgi:hypothetical protein